MSSAEAEYYSMVNAASEGLGLKAMTMDYRKPLSLWMFIDATAAIGVAQRVGRGKLRHLETQSLWLQEAVRDQRIGLSKVHGPVSPADLMTKHVDHATQIRLLALMSVEARVGRAETAPETGEVDEQVCSGESATEEVKEHECERQNNDEEAIEWVHECMDGWGDEFITGPFGAGDAQPKPKCTEKEEMDLGRKVNISSCQTRYNATETESSSD